MITKLLLKNFKCFQSQSFPMRNLTLLTGVNGAGKSTVIQSLLAIRQSYERDLLESAGLSLNGDLVNLGKATDILFEDAENETIEITIDSQANGSANWAFDYQSITDVLKSLPSSRVDGAFFTEPLFNDRFQYLAAERIGPRVSYKTSDFFVTQHRRLGSQGEFAAHFLSVFGEREISNSVLHHPNSVNKQLLGQVEAWMSEVTPGTRIHTTRHLGMDLINLEYSFAHAKETTKQYRSTNVGFGITYTLPVLLAVLSAEPGDLLLIENPEAHLHPRGQRKLGELLALAAKSGVQLIVESHSDHLLNGIRVAVRSLKVEPSFVQVHFFTTDRNNSKKSSSLVSPVIDNEGRIDQWPDGFFDEWDRSLEALLQK